MTELPPYADNPLGRALIAEIIAIRPDSRLIRDDWGCRDTEHYVGKPCSLLRKLHREWLQRQYTRLDRQFAITGVWDAAEGRAIHEAEDANRLIKRVLREAGERRARAA
jgi:hypothetical protein